MHEVISAAVDPTTALSVGLKVDAEALPAAVVQGIQNGSVDLHEPGDDRRAAQARRRRRPQGHGRDGRRQGRADARRHHLRAVPLDRRQLVRARHRQAARRLAQPRPEPRRDHRAVAGVRRRRRRRVQLLGSGQVRPALQHRRPEQAGRSSRRRTASPASTASPSPATAASIAYWNRYVAVTQMGGHGTFTEPRLQPEHHERQRRSRHRASCPRCRRISCRSTRRRRRRAASTRRPRRAASRCSKAPAVVPSCHSGALFTDANSTLHPPADSMAEPETPSYAARSATKSYRTTPLRGVWQHAPYFHDGSAATLEEVVATYNARRSLGLTRAAVGRPGPVPEVALTPTRRQVLKTGQSRRRSPGVTPARRRSPDPA